MGERTQQRTAGTATLGGVPSTTSTIATLSLFCLMLFTWACVGHTLATDMPAVWVVAASMAALASSIALVAAVCIRTTSNLLARHAATVAAVTNGHAERMEATTAAHAERSEVIARWHAGESRKQILDLNWLAVASARGKARAEIDAAHAAERARLPSDTGPLPAMRI